MKKIKLFDPVVGMEEERAVKNTLQSHFWAAGAGTGNVARFEIMFKKYVGSDECIALNSGTAALHLALSLIDIKGKEVLLPSLSFVSTAHAVVYNGGRPVFVDIDPNTLCLDPSSIRKAITKRTKAILPVHFAGMPCKLDEIKRLCDKFDLMLIEDAAHAAGTIYKRKRIGSHGVAVCFSFHPVKNLAMPTGGAITLNGQKSNEFGNIIKSRRWCGISDRKGSKYDVKQLGWNYYMNEFSAAIGIEQLKKLDEMNFKRKQIAKKYSEEIEIEKKMPFNEDCSYHFYWIEIHNRNSFIKKMFQNGIETGIHYKPIHTMKFYKGSTKLPNTESVGERIVSIPIHPNLTQDDVNKIIQLTNKFGK